MSRFLILFALFTLSVNTANALTGTEDIADILRDEFHSQAAQFNYDPSTKRFSYKRQACTDRVLVHIADKRGWTEIATEAGIKTPLDVIAFRPKIRLIYQGVCLQ